MNELFADFEYVRAYIDDLLCISNGTYEDHLVKLDKILDKMKKAGFKGTAKNPSFVKKN